MKQNLADVLQLTNEKLKRSIFTGLPAVVVEYNAAQSIATVLPLVDAVYSDGVVKKSQLIYNIPVQWPSGGGGIISFPIKQGDTGWVAFACRSIDEWVYGDGGSVVPASSRTLDYNDAIFIPGITTVNTSLNPDPDNVQIKFAGSSITIKPSGQVVISASSITLNGDTTINGNLNVSGDVEGDGKGNFVSGVEKNSVPYNHP